MPKYAKPKKVSHHIKNRIMKQRPLTQTFYLTTNNYVHGHLQITLKSCRRHQMIHLSSDHSKVIAFSLFRDRESNSLFNYAI